MKFEKLVKLLEDKLLDEKKTPFQKLVLSIHPPEESELGEIANKIKIKDVAGFVEFFKKKYGDTYMSPGAIKDKALKYKKENK